MDRNSCPSRKYKISSIEKIFYKIGKNLQRLKKLVHKPIILLYFNYIKGD